MSKDLVEKVARAMWMADPDPYDPPERRPFEEIEENTKRQIRAEAIAAISVVLEEAAKLAEVAPYKRGGMVCVCSEGLADWIANSIRSLFEEEKNG